MSAGEGETVFEPAPERWAGLVARGPIGGRDREFRRELGLPTGAPVVMSGHQPILWHPGILAKWFAMGALARRVGGSAAWLVAEQDTGDPWTIEAPVSGPAGPIARRFSLSRSAGANVPFAMQPTVRPRAIESGSGWAPSSVGDGLERIAREVDRHSSAGSASEQVVLATRGLLGPFGDAPAMVFARALARTSLFREVLARMTKDPGACVKAYNSAVASHPDSGLRTLPAGDDPELPIWRLADGARRRVTARGLQTGPIDNLMPKAILMTGLVRLSACDLFIHGLGGGKYEPAADAWLGEWLGEKPRAPHVVTSATLRLDFEQPSASAAEVARLAGAAHRASNNPRLLGDDDAAGQKNRLLAAIGGSPRKSRERQEAFAQLRALIQASQIKHSAELERIREQSLNARSLRAVASTIDKRTWAFPLYGEPALSRLKSRIERAFSGS